MSPYRKPDPPPVDPGPTWWERNGDDVRAIVKFLGIVTVGFLGICALVVDCNREKAKANAIEAEIQKDPVKDCERFRDRTTAGTPMRCLKHFGVAR